MSMRQLMGHAYMPNTPAFISPQAAISAKAFTQDVQARASQLAQMSQQRWALCFNHAYDFSVNLLAVLAANRCPVLLPNHQSGTLKLFHLEYDGILSDIPLIEATELKPPHANTDIALSPGQPLIFFTSGSTGQPKKVTRLLRTLCHEIHMLEHMFGQQLQDAAIYTTVSYQHVYGLLFYILWPLLCGRSIATPMLHYPEAVTAVLSGDKKVALISSPTLLSRLDVQFNSKVKPIIFSSGGLLKAGDVNRLHNNLDIIPIEILGSTETGAVAYRQQAKDILWQALPQVSISQAEVSQGLIVESPFFDEISAIEMGDRVELVSPTQFNLLERTDRIVKIEGKRLSLAAIEDSIKAHSLVISAYACVIESHRQLLAVAIVLSAEGCALLQQKGKLHMNALIHAWLVALYEPVLCPKKIRFIENIPFNTQGKIVYEDIKQLFEAEV